MSRNWCFTLNNWTDEEYETLTTYECKYLIIGKEIGTKGTEHLQGYIEFKGVKRLDTLKKLNNRIHWEHRKGTAKQAADYCKKDNKYIEYGEISNQGKRSDLEQVAEKIKSNIPMKEIAYDHPSTFIRYNKGMQALKNILTEHRTIAPTVYWRWGAPGTGKTRYVIDKYGAENVYIKNNSEWWPDYNQEPIVLIDDFDPTKWDHSTFLSILDRYKCTVPCKGGHYKFNSPTIYITTQQNIRTLYPNKTKYKEVIRRVSDVSEVTGNTIPSPTQVVKIPILDPREDNLDEEFIE